MISLSLLSISSCLSKDSATLKTTDKIAIGFAILETITYIGIALLGYLIHTNSLPSSLQFLKGRMQLGTALMATGITCLSLLSIPLVYANCKG